ncbi:thioredoxin-like isoform X1 [Microcaecilia unicolor]|uniref:Thioredoxin n=1 Tax=Microcaecilia unicolor TaxID=1415580 RepID=A0A6P7XDH2_9AMPH|nr:thioredoxin-like isoform X1 [Microcaecilia unicolor]
MVMEVKSKGKFHQILKEQGDKLVIVNFTASWCMSCRMTAPYYQELSEKYKDILFLQVDVDDVHGLAESYRIQSLPTFMFFKEGKQVANVEGISTAQLKAKIEELKS